ncbi:MAG TPA: Gfo/Idh/MocA family oxidoreductase [Tepidisphaeraceae bacterium]|nr:Gfo/Idh/MocA family oxidoreductase [Tepidisphaeraceae bacterium]
MAEKKEYGLKELSALKAAAAPALGYEPPRPTRYSPPIALVGCGGISEKHLAAYKKMGLNVVAVCDRHLERAEQRRRAFFPRAKTCTDYKEVLKRDDVEIVDFTTYPNDRDYQIPDALNAGKHVLSQKPFVMDLDRGQELVELADKRGVRLAVNQNGRWAPHYSYIRAAVAKHLLGDITAAHLAVHWDHEWIEATKFNDLHHIVLYDFGIHWFDMLSAILPGRKPKRVFSTLTRSRHQRAKPPLLGQTLVEYDGAQASLVFDAVTKFGHLDETFVTGSKGTIVSRGRDLTHQTVTLYTGKGAATPKLRGTWFVEGFMGTMGELLCAIEEKRPPANSAANNLEGLSICFAAVRSAESGRAETVGKVRCVSIDRRY